jgi:4'-phosphopantetheinyl transferase EntD
VLGSITHCPGYALAAVTRTGAAMGLGLDMEPLLDPSGAEILAQEFLSPAECALIRPVRPTLGVTALLSIKESAFKALSRHARSGQIPGWPPGCALQVRWRQVGRWIVSGCVMVGSEVG